MSDKVDFAAIVLAAGKGTRMKSARAKVLHELAGRALVTYPVEAALGAGAGRVVAVVGYDRSKVEVVLKERFGERVITALQFEQRGTGDAARCGFEALGNFAGWLVVLYGDCPLLTSRALRALLEAAAAARGPLAMLVCDLGEPAGYGRILRDQQGRVKAVRERKDCDASELAIKEVNPGVYAIRGDFFRDAVARLTASNAQRELYLTDLVEEAARAGGVADVKWDAVELQGINDRFDLAECERELRRQIARRHALSGVTVRDPNTAYIDMDVAIEPEAVIESQVSLRGKCVIGAGARVDVGCVLTDVIVRPGAQLLPYTVATGSGIGESARVGPFTHLRPETRLGPEVHIGNFVETKKTQVGRGSKANHLSYLGDGVIGERVNVGAGTIFCNYDGFNKYTTVLEDDCFIGSDTQIVAPLTVGRGGYVATGTTLTTNVPPDTLAISRVRQDNKPGFALRIRKHLQAHKKQSEGKK